MKFKMPTMKSVMGRGIPAAAGGASAGLVANLAKKVITNPTGQKFLPIAPWLVGLFISENKGGWEAFGNGMMGVGGQKTAGAFIPALAGIEDADLSGIFDESVADDINDDMSGNSPLNDSPLHGAGEDYAQDY